MDNAGHCIGNSQPLYHEITGKLTEIESVLAKDVTALQRQDIGVLNDFEAVSKGLADIETLASTYFLNCVLSEYTECSRTISRSVHRLSVKGQGALIVIEKKDPVDSYLTGGIPVNAKVSSPLLESVFYPDSPLGKGAALIRSGRMVSAANDLLLPDRMYWDWMFDYREAAAIGLTQRCDALVLLVYENGDTSFSIHGNLYPFTRSGR